MPSARVHFRAGFASADITPDPGSAPVELGGYVARQQPATGVRDPLRAAVLALGGTGEEPHLLVGLDLCILDEQAASRIAGACPVPDDHVMLCCSHSHSAPSTYPLIGCGRPDAAYLRLVSLAVGNAARRALAEAVPCRLGWGRRPVPARWVNRRDAKGPSDARLHLLKLERADSTRQPICAVWSVACHPVVLGAENRLVSADWVGEVVRALPCPSLFLQGFCGDQNPTERGPSALPAWSSLAADSEALWAVTPTAPSGPLGWRRRPLELARLPGDEVAGLPGAGPAGAALREWASRAARPRQAIPPTPASVAACRVGNGKAVFWPGEPHLAHALALPPDCLGVGHSGASVGYVPERAAYPHGGYEVVEAHRYYGFPSALAPEAGEALLAASTEMLADLS